VDKNKTGTSFPSDTLSRAEKNTREFCLQFAKAVEGYAISSSYNFDNERQRLKELRTHAEGRQSVEQYKSQISINGGTTDANISWDISSPLPAYVNKIVGKLTARLYIPHTKAIAPETEAEVDKERKQVFADYIYYQMAKAVEAESGISILKPNKKYPTNEDEVELALLHNGKTGAMQSTDLLLRNFLSRVREVDYDAYIRDLVITNRIVIKTTLDRLGNINYERQVPEDFGASLCRKDDYSDAKFMYGFRLISIDQLRIECQDELRKGTISEEDIFNAAKSSSGLYGNPQFTWGSWNQYYNSTSSEQISQLYDSFTVGVFDIEYKSASNVKYQKKPRGGKGAFILQQLKKGEVPKYEVVEETTGTIYKATLVRNSSIVYNYGELENMIRYVSAGDYEPTPQFSYAVIQPNMLDMKSRSIVDRLVPYANIVIIAWLKVQQSIARAVPKGIAVDISALSETVMATGGKAWKPLDYSKYYRITGDHFYSSFNPVTGQIGNQQPIRELENGMSADLERFVGVAEAAKRQMDDAVGFSQGADSNTPTEKLLVGVQKQLSENTNNALRPYVRAWEDVYKRSLRNVITLMQYNINYNPSAVETYAQIVGAGTVKALELLGDTKLACLGIDLEVVADAEEMARIEVEGTEAMKAGAIRYSDLLELKDMLKQSPAKAKAYLKIKESKYAKEKAQQEQRNMQMNAQVQQQSAAQKAQQDLAIEQAKVQGEILLLNTKHSQTLELEDLKNRHKLMQITLEGEQKQDQIEAAKDMNPVSPSGSDLTKTAIPESMGIREPSVMPSAARTSPSDIMGG